MPDLKLYVATTEKGPTKIGVSKNPQKRMLTLGRYPPPTLVHIECVPQGLNALDVEKLAHSLVSSFREGHFEAEWFNITPETAVEAVKRAMAMAQSDDCTIAWGVRLQLTPKTKEQLHLIADEDEVKVEKLISSILHDYITARSTT